MTPAEHGQKRWASEEEMLEAKYDPVDAAEHGQERWMPNGRNAHWLVCRGCLAAWPPDDINEGHRHFEGPDDGPWEECKGELVDLVPADREEALMKTLEQVRFCYSQGVAPGSDWSVVAGFMNALAEDALDRIQEGR